MSEQFERPMGQEGWWKNFSNIGVHAHEFAHLLHNHINDHYYPYATDGGWWWTLMADGCNNGLGMYGQCPAPLHPRQRELLGWQAYHDINSYLANEEITYNNDYNYNEVCRLYPRDNSGNQITTEYFILENRQTQTGWNKKIYHTFAPPDTENGEYLSSSEGGLLLWRINGDSYKLVPADNSNLKYNLYADAFRSGNNTCINDFTIPSTRYSGGVYQSNIVISNISSCASNMTANLSPFWAGTLPQKTTWTNAYGIYVGDNFTVPSGTDTLTIDAVNVYIASGKKIDVYGTLITKNSVGFYKSSASNWSGIDIQSGGSVTINANATIENAVCGVDLYGGALYTGSNTLTIRNCSDVGICINSGAPTINNVRCVNCGSYYGGIVKLGTTNNPTFMCSTVDSSAHGLYIGGDSTVDYCDFKNTNTGHTITFFATSAVNLNGYNNICRKDNTVKAINNRTDSNVDAQYNWWGNTPTDDYFSFPAYVNYTNYRPSTVTEAGVYKTAIQDTPLNIAKNLEFSGNYQEALSKYSEIFATEENTGWKKFLLTSMLRAHDNSDKNYSDLKELINSELPNSSGYYKAALNFILNDIYVREGKYDDAVNGFFSNSEKYKGTSMETEMLSRIAEIYGVNLKNKEKALEYANKAALLNPGQLILKSAYNAAGIEYNPAIYADKYKDVVENFDIQAEPKKPASEELTNSVLVSPNPFNPITTINYTIASPGHVSLSIYNIAGQKVATLVNGEMTPGKHTAQFDGSPLASGVYFYRFEAGKFNKTGKMLLVK